MDTSDFNELAEFVFDQSTPESDEGTHLDESPDVLLPHSRMLPNRRGRRRARKACVACNKRKVRCDVLSPGHTCTNCGLDGITCRVRSGGKRVRETQPGRIEEVPANTSTELRPLQLVTRPFDTSIADPPLGIESIEVGAVTPSLPCSQPFYFANPFFIPARLPQPRMNTEVMYAYFDFLETETWTHIAPEDFTFLEYKGCFHLPSRPVLDDLVREYFLHVHPVLPIINEREFWEMYNPSSRRVRHNKIPLFVFRAMLFVSCSFASDATIHQLGFQSAVEARTCMYRRSKLLYDFNTTSDPIALSQGALILTYYSSDQEPLANTSWLRLAIQYANSVNVEMYNQDLSISAEDRLVRKRLWWCLILRDRILPLGVRRPIQITRNNFDFSQPKLSAKDLEPEFRKSLVYDEETKRDLATIFLAQIELAIELTDPISYIYPANGFRSFDKLDCEDMLQMQPTVQRCKEGLDIWNTSFRKSIGPDTWPTKHKSIALYSGLTSIYYQSARAALCQYESFSLQGDYSTRNELRMRELGGVLHSSVANISDTVREFMQLDVAKYLPVSMVAYLALPIILNSLDLQTLTPKGARTKSKLRQLKLLNEAMDMCHERYTGTTAASTLIKRTIEAARSEHDVGHNQFSKSTSLLPSSPDITNWFDVFVSRPTQYLRISFAIDISFCTGRYPDTEDCLPQRLASHHQLTLPPPIPRTLIPGIENLDNNSDWSNESLTTNIRLDFFDFSDLQTCSKTEGSLWNGQEVDELLDEILGEGGRF